MTKHLDNLKFSSFLSHFLNASLVNIKGELLFSKDSATFKTTTSRLVLFQICKKYFTLQPGDIYICNDPQSGGTALHRLYFIGCLNPNLFVIWDNEFLNLNIKIPPTPIVEKKLINQMILSALISALPGQTYFESFLKAEFHHFTSLFKLQSYIDLISSEKYQKNWFKTCEDIFKLHFELKALGQTEFSHTYKDIQFRFNLDITEKQEQKQIKIDFSGLKKSVGINTDFSAASHVVESGLMIEISKFYNIEKYLSQSVLDHIKLLLPPKSTLSTTHSTGDYNFEIQKMTRQFIRHALTLINTPGKAQPKKLSLYSTYLMHISKGDLFTQVYLSNSRIQFNTFDFFKPHQLNLVDGIYHGKISATENSPDLHIKLMGVQGADDIKERWIKFNSKEEKHHSFSLTEKDHLEFKWKT